MPPQLYIRPIHFFSCHSFLFFLTNRLKAGKLFFKEKLTKGTLKPVCEPSYK